MNYKSISFIDSNNLLHVVNTGFKGRKSTDDFMVCISSEVFIIFANRWAIALVFLQWHKTLLNKVTKVESSLSLNY